MAADSRPWATTIAAAIIGVALVAGTLITAQTIDYVKTFNTSLLTVTGTAETVVTSDQVQWSGSYSVNASQGNLKQGYAAMANDASLVTAFLEKAGLPQSDITLSPVSMNLNYVDCKASPSACGPYGPDTYQLTQSVQVNSSQVQTVTRLAQNLEPLVQAGVPFSSQGLNYYYSRLAGLRAKMLADATRNARQRADQITGSVGSHVGQLISVTTEPFQITPVNSAQVSNGGQYDTTTIQKQVQAIVQATFRLQ